ncbi:GTP 3',8-cyclase MoaA [Paenarthrobacter sp. CM16]|uniref:GTP 3',8-cyclase MoaA n=1 Tax=Paenarthrobacter sp. CM16 TaxID=2738447 RepID=UPI001553AE14|nr:GTP 3',8-cyclase MoaA [Paenarthrobacter sp. CM16]NQD86445.1 GTP 3',8-cyclase MoaA [Paenarthrobacter sp. CM16]
MTTVSLGFPRLRPSPLVFRQTDRPTSSQLVDRMGRTARDLRISVTEKCSLKCTYCMPEEGLPAIPRQCLLSPAEIGRLVRIATTMLGIREVRFTGGEPLMRADLEDIVAESRSVAPDTDLSITTNAIGLDRRINGLVEAGLNRLNISLDTIDRSAFARLTRRDRLKDVLSGIRAASTTTRHPLKINAVLMQETLDQAPDLLAWALEHGHKLRFIEQMPLDADHAWAKNTMVPAEELLGVLRERFTLTNPFRTDPSAPAEEWLINGGPYTVGIIAAVTRPFCADCDRTRITAEGTIRTCLFSDDETDLVNLLRSGADDALIADTWRAAMWNKPAGHGMEEQTFVPPHRSMGAIGG